MVKPVPLLPPMAGDELYFESENEGGNAFLPEQTHSVRDGFVRHGHDSEPVSDDERVQERERKRERETDSVEKLEKEFSPVESANNLSPKKMSRNLKRSQSRSKNDRKGKTSNSMQRINRAMEKLRKENQLQLTKSDVESEAEKQSESWKESLSVTKHSASDRLEAGQSKPYLYATGAGFVLGRMYNSRKPGKGWLDSSHH